MVHENRAPRVTHVNRSLKGAAQRPQRLAHTSSQDSSPANVRASIERYKALAVNAAAGGDRVQAERYYQQAEHCIKVMNGASD
jgi:hypothetical protein